jgi:hypothetical protein
VTAAEGGGGGGVVVLLFGIFGGRGKLLNADPSVAPPPAFKVGVGWLPPARDCSTIMQCRCLLTYILYRNEEEKQFLIPVSPTEPKDCLQ